MLKEILPRELGEMIEERYNFSGVYELRVRTGMPIYLNYHSSFVPLRNLNGQLIIADKRLVDFILARATDLSLYKYNNQIKNGFISVTGGIRIGLAGEVVVGEDKEVKTIKNYSGLVIRIPHEVKGCSQDVMPFIADEKSIKNTLLISPPGCGKTTFLRDIARNLSLLDKMYNTLIVDERYEISAVENGVNTLDVGEFSDILSGSSKEYGFNEGIRALRPDVIITDEISNKSDASAVKYAKNSGVKVIASAHGFNHYDIKQKPFFSSIISERVFDRYIVLSDRNGVGTIELVLNSVFEPLMVAQ